MKLTFDLAKRAKTLKERGLDFADAAKVFAHRHLAVVDDRRAMANRVSSRLAMPAKEWSSWCGRREMAAAGLLA